MGNFLSFIDIYEKTEIAAENGDFLAVVYQIARLIRRIMDFQSMQRGSLEDIVQDVHRLTSYLNYYATIDENGPKI
jgi:hypothetical protein